MVRLFQNFPKFESNLAKNVRKVGQFWQKNLDTYKIAIQHESLHLKIHLNEM